jgi:hypothetical protein
MDSKVLIDGSWGIYVPQRFAQNYPQYIDPEEADIFETGPEHEHYWDTWDEVLERTILTDFEGNRYRLEQDDDLFAVPEE